MTIRSAEDLNMCLSPTRIYTARSTNFGRSEFVLGCLLLTQTAAFAASTFDRDVLPILQKNCQTCHRPGEVAPMSFLNYESTRPWAKAIKAAVLTRKMPPWPADPRYGHFSNDRTLKQEEIDTIVDWVNGGAVEGDSHDRPPAVEWPEGWTIPP